MKDSKQSTPSTPSRGGWRVWVSWFILVLFAGEILAALLIPRKDKSWAMSQFARLPLLFDGRLQPVDSLARNSLIQIRETMSVPLEGNGEKGAWGTWEELRAKGGGVTNAASIEITNAAGVELTERRWYQFSKHPKKLKPADWLLEVICSPRQADDRYIFAINHPDLRSLLKLDDGVERSGLHYYRFNDIKDQLDAMQVETERVSKLDPSQRLPFDRAVFRLNNAIRLYFRLKNTFQPEDSPDFPKEMETFLATLPAEPDARLALDSAVTHYIRLRELEREKPDGDHSRQLELTQASISELLATARRTVGGEPFTRDSIEPLFRNVGRYNAMARLDVPLVVPPAKHEDPHEWRRMGQTMLDSITEGVPDSARLLAGMTTAYRENEVGKFNELLGTYRGLLEKQGLTAALSKGGRETFFNQLLPFKRSMYVYIMAFVMVLMYWLTLNNLWRVTAARLVVLGFIVHTAGLLFRMWLEGRPPVTNLYSSAIFIGWAAVVLGMVLERFFKDGIGLVVAAVVGFLTLIVAHNLSLGGDTMIMMQAVLDTNFWLATHVVIITLGYASTFVAGFLGLAYVVMGVFTRMLTSPTSKTSAHVVAAAASLVVKTDFSHVKTAKEVSAAAEKGELGKSLARMAYGIVCFATLFSFVGTVLGGIWADQSWGRFWGWDTKENGALIIVLWNALVLHLRWGGIIRERGLMNCVIVGNIVTSWSWFGVNLLGIGLHAYGFMDGAFTALLLFVSSQLILIGVGLTPARFWSSAPARFAKPPLKSRAFALGVPLFMVACLIIAGYWWSMDLAGASRVVAWFLALAGAYLVVMLCVAFADRLETKSKAVPTDTPPSPPPPPPPETVPTSRAKPQPA